MTAPRQAVAGGRRLGPAPTTGSAVTPLLRLAVHLLDRHADRSDPVREAVRCLTEAAAQASALADTLAQTRSEDVPDRLAEVLATARAAVVCASFAVVESSGRS